MHECVCVSLCRVCECVCADLLCLERCPLGGVPLAIFGTVSSALTCFILLLLTFMSPESCSFVLKLCILAKFIIR